MIGQEPIAPQRSPKFAGWMLPRRGYRRRLLTLAFDSRLLNSRTLAVSTWKHRQRSELRQQELALLASRDLSATKNLRLAQYIPCSCWPILLWTVSFQEFYRAYFKCLGKLVQRYNRWISTAAFKAADVLLADPRNLGKPFLRPALFQPDPPDILSDQFPHIHADGSAGCCGWVLSTIVCNQVHS